MSKVHVSRRELKSSFHRLAAAAGPKLVAASTRIDAVAILIGLHAVECGLKLILLESRGLHSTDKLSEDDLTHDPNELLRRIGQPIRFPSTVVAEAPSGVRITPGHFHELYRYGGRMAGNVEHDLAAALLDVVTHIRENLPS